MFRTEITIGLDEVIPRFIHFKLCELRPYYPLIGESFNRWLPVQSQHADFVRIVESDNINYDLQVRLHQVMHWYPDSDLTLDLHKASFIPYAFGEYHNKSYPIRFPIGFDLKQIIWSDRQPLANDRFYYSAINAKYFIVKSKHHFHVCRSFDENKPKGIIGYYTNVPCCYIVCHLHDMSEIYKSNGDSNA